MPLAEGLASSSLSLLQRISDSETYRFIISHLLPFAGQFALLHKKATAVIIQVGLYQMNPCLLR